MMFTSFTMHSMLKRATKQNSNALKGGWAEKSWGIKGWDLIATMMVKVFNDIRRSKSGMFSLL